MRDLADWRLHAYAIIDISRILQLTLISFQEENGKNEKQISCYILQWNIWLCLWILLQLYTLFPNTYSWHHNMVRWLTQDSWNQLRTLPKQGSKPFFFFFFLRELLISYVMTTGLCLRTNAIFNGNSLLIILRKCNERLSM